MNPMRRRKLLKSELDDTILELVRATSHGAHRAPAHTLLGVWACDCAGRVLALFEESFPDDDRPAEAIEAGRRWIETGIFRMADVRRASLGAHAAARDAEGNAPAQAAARAAGHAVATAHVADHAAVAAIYAATAVGYAARTEELEDAVAREREWQYRHLLALLGKEPAEE